jgi:hypothetical protein
MRRSWRFRGLGPVERTRVTKTLGNLGGHYLALRVERVKTKLQLKFAVRD